MEPRTGTSTSPPCPAQCKCLPNKGSAECLATTSAQFSSPFLRWNTNQSSSSLNTESRFIVQHHVISSLFVFPDFPPTCERNREGQVSHANRTSEAKCWNVRPDPVLSARDHLVNTKMGHLDRSPSVGGNGTRPGPVSQVFDLLGHDPRQRLRLGDLPPHVGAREPPARRVGGV